MTIAKGRRRASEIQWQPGGISCALGRAGLAKCMLHSCGLVIRRNYVSLSPSEAEWACAL